MTILTIEGYREHRELYQICWTGWKEFQIARYASTFVGWNFEKGREELFTGDERTPRLVVGRKSVGGFDHQDVK
ncbi:MAG TPA: hypothetical protein VKZ59_04555 [Acidobacteriota bacterium]|nr:hypothetical protein [Acidobacteriota bacterium]